MKLRKAHLADEAEKFIGHTSILYRGPEIGCDENGFDCSGFVWFLLKRIGFTFNHKLRHCNEFFDQLGVLIHRRAVQRGDLVFFCWDGVVPRHIGIMTSATHYIHAPGTDGSRVVIEELKQTPINRLNPLQIYFENPIGFKRLALPRGRYHRVLR